MCKTSVVFGGIGNETRVADTRREALRVLRYRQGCNGRGTICLKTSGASETRRKSFATSEVLRIPGRCPEPRIWTGGVLGDQRGSRDTASSVTPRTQSPPGATTTSDEDVRGERKTQDAAERGLWDEEREKDLRSGWRRSRLGGRSRALAACGAAHVRRQST